jgi:hypothetical protein
MTINWLAAFAFFGGGPVLLLAAVALLQRSERRLGNGSDEYGTRVTPRQTADDEIAAYLDRMTTELKLPAGDVAEVRAELLDHVRDSIASLEAQGFDQEGAIREALGRLGPPAELGRHLRAAHQSTRRLLAGAGGGVFAAGGGFVLGYLGGIALALLGLLAGVAVGALLAVVGVRMPDITSHDGGNTVNSLLWATTLAIAVATATRYAVRTSAGLSQRAPRTVAVFWAAAGAVVFGWLAVFGMRGPQSWPSVALELCVPMLAVASAFVWIERPMPHVGRWAVIVAALSVVAMSLGVVAYSGSSVSVSGSSQTSSFQMSDLHFDTVAPMAPAAWLPEGIITDGGWGSDPASGGTRVDHTVGANPAMPIAEFLKNWHEIRFEAWHALPMSEPGPGGVDTRYSAPLAIQPAVLSGNSLSAVFHFERLRDAGSWWIFMTAMGPDGHRYRILDGGGGNSFFNGSAWDWLTAPQ